MDTPQLERSCCFFFLLSYIHPFVFFITLTVDSYVPFSCIFGSGSSLSSLCIISVLSSAPSIQSASKFTTILIMQFLYSFHAISHCCHAMPLLSLRFVLVCCSFHSLFSG